MQNHEHPFSWPALTRIILAGGAIYLIWRLFDTIMLIVVSLMLAAAFYPIVERLEKKIPRTIASVLVVLTLFIPIAFLIINFISNLVDQFPQILQTLDNTLNNSALLPPALRNIDLSSYAQNAASYLLRSTSRLTGFITTFFTLIFLIMYLLIDTNRLKKIILTMIPDKHEKKIQAVAEEIIKINGQYIRGNLIISLICGVTIFIGLFLLNVRYAASLALFAGLMDLLPLIGSIIGAVPAVIIAFTISPTVGIATVALFLLYQQIENNILAPNIYNKALDLSPALSFLAVIIGTALFGVVGAFIALPIAASVPTIIKYWKNIQ